MASSVGRVGGVCVGVVDHGPEECGGGDSFGEGVGDWGAVVEGDTVAAYVEDDFGYHLTGPTVQQVFEGVGMLLSDRCGVRGRV